MKKNAKTALIAAAVLLVAIQLVPVKRTNPAGPDTFDAPPEVKEIIRRSCYDCHSNETKWPAYAHIAPFSWILAGHVKEGREKLNFTDWAKLSDKKLGHKRSHIVEELEEGGMPLPGYLMIHKEAKLTAEQKQAIIKWASAGKKTGAKRDEDEEEEEHDHEGH